MLYRRKGFPEEDEIVLCTITKVYPHAVFTNLDEFDKTAVIHISEIAPGRIRNIRNYVKEGKKVICKVLRIRPQKGHIDISLRRVNDAQRRNKKDEIKQEIMAEKILEFVAHKLDRDVRKIYNEITEKIFKKYGNLYSCFGDIIAGKTTLESLGVDKKLAEEITPIIKQRIKPPEVKIEGKLLLECPSSEGIEIIKDTLSKALDVDGDIAIRYDSAGKYNLVVRAQDYPEAEKILDKVVNVVVSHIEKNKGSAKFERKK